MLKHLCGARAPHRAKPHGPHPNHMTPEPAPANVSEDFAQTDDAGAPDEENGAESGSRRRTLAPSVADILQQEAELESQERARETSGLESQPDLGLDSAQTQAARQARDRMARKYPAGSLSPENTKCL